MIFHSAAYAALFCSFLLQKTNLSVYLPPPEVYRAAGHHAETNGGKE